MFPPALVDAVVAAARPPYSSSATPGASGHPRRVQDVREELEPVDQAGPGTREVRRGVDGDDAAGAQRRQMVGVGAGLLERARRVVAAGHDDHHLGLGRGDGLPVELLGVLAGQAEQVRAAGILDELRRPVTGDEQRIEPLERRHGTAARPADGEADTVDTPGAARDQRHRLVAPSGGLGDRADVGERLAERVRVQRDDPRRRGQSCRRAP